MSSRLKAWGLMAWTVIAGMSTAFGWASAAEPPRTPPTPARATIRTREFVQLPDGRIEVRFVTRELDGASPTNGTSVNHGIVVPDNSLPSGPSPAGPRPNGAPNASPGDIGSAPRPTSGPATPIGRLRQRFVEARPVETPGPVTVTESPASTGRTMIEGRGAPATRVLGWGPQAPRNVNNGVVSNSGWVAENRRTVSAPTGVVASDEGDHLHVGLSWDGPATPNVTYKVERQSFTAGAGWSSVGVVTAVQNRTDVTISPGPGVYRFRISADSGDGNPAPSPWFDLSIADPTQAPGVPLGLTATDLGNRRAMVSWTAGQGTAASFEIERDPPFGSGVQTVGGSTTNMIDACGAGDFAYRVRAIASDGAPTGFTMWSTVTVGETLPSTPTSVVATDAGNEHDVLLAWVPESNNAATYYIEHEFKDIDGVWLNAGANEVDADGDNTRIDAWGGQHRFRITARNAMGGSPPSDWALVTVQSSWTVFTASQDTRIVYVSSSSGSDSFDGLSRDKPKATINAAYALMRNGYPDWMLLKRGDSWSEETPMWTVSGRSLSEPMVMSAYGEATARPILNMGVSQPGWYAAGFDPTRVGIKFIVVDSLDFRATRPGGDLGNDQGAGVLIFRTAHDIRFEGCRWRNFGGSTVNIQNIQDDQSTVDIDRITFFRCQLLDSYNANQHAQGIFLNTAKHVTFDECLIDHNGWKDGVAGTETIFNHNFYVRQQCDGFTLKNSISSRASSHGLSMNYDGLVQNNLFLENGVGMFARTMGVTVEENVVLEGRDIAANPRGMGMDFGPVWPEAPNPPGGPLTVRNNIVSRRNMSISSGSNQAYGFEGNSVALAQNVTFESNIAYDWRTPSFVLASAQVNDTVSIVGNDFQEPGLGTLIIQHTPSNFTHVTYSGNRYYTIGNSNTWFYVGGTTLSYGQWITRSSEPGGSSHPVTYPDPGRDIPSYMTSIQKTPTTAAFLNSARDLHRRWWDQRYTARAVNAYIKQGFGR